jgi:hypothetical protein
VMGQREQIELPDLLDRIAAFPVETDVSRERGYLTTEADNSWHTGGSGQQRKSGPRADRA